MSPGGQLAEALAASEYCFVPNQELDTHRRLSFGRAAAKVIAKQQKALASSASKRCMCGFWRRGSG